MQRCDLSKTTSELDAADLPKTRHGDFHVFVSDLFDDYKNHLGRVFDPGACATPPAALDAIEKAGLEIIELLDRHVTGDWGDLCERDCQANEAALECGSWILSYYRLPTGQKIYIITDAKGDDGSRQATGRYL